ncbi:MAG: NAD-dependent protein deacylase Cob2 [Anaerolineales bacterium]
MASFSGQIQEAIIYAADLVRRARHTVILTGAGISTPSGIPDFRSDGRGLWAKDEPLEVASQLIFRTHPEKFFAWFRPLASSILEAQPNAAHLALAQLESRGLLQTILTQNIDILHQKAGSRRVIELHGTLSTLSCTQCYRQFNSADFLDAFLRDAILPHCPVCGALLKPDVILFGEQLPQKALDFAQREARQCDLMIVAGSSLEVLPVAGLPMQAIDRGAHLIILNNSPTYLSVRADINIYADVAAVLPAIVEETLAHG